MEVQIEKGSFATKCFFKSSYIPSILKKSEARKAHNILKHSTLGLTCAMLEQAVLLGVSPNEHTRCLGLNAIQKSPPPWPYNNPGSERVQPSLKQVCVFQEDK